MPDECRILNTKYEGLSWNRILLFLLRLKLWQFFFFFWLGNELLLVINEFLSYLLQTLNSDLMDNIKILCFSQQKFKG